MSRRKRQLSADEKALWSKVVETATPTERTLRKPDTPIVKPEGKPAPNPPRIDPFEIEGPNHLSRNSVTLQPSVAQSLATAPLQMDRKAFTRMKRGKLIPEAKLDLHGMTQDHAYPELNRFIHRSYGLGYRLVLVITGKGKNKDDMGPIPVRFGVLKHQVPQWLRHGDMAPLILQITQANVKHGGSGAYYVYLKRRR